VRPIPLNLLTLYAGLLQNVAFADVPFGSVTKRRNSGQSYLYLTRKDGTVRQQLLLGRADDPHVQAQAESHLRAARLARERRTTISALKTARMPAPSLALGRVLEAVANAGLFQSGMILVGTAAYQTYACVVGHYLSSSAVTTEDADFLVVSFVGGGEVDLASVLRRADPTFRAKMSQGDTLPKVFEADNSFQVELLTKFGRGRRTPVPFEGLGVSAVALPFMEYLAEESIEAVALYGAGVLVRVPPPLRYAAHKLLIAQERSNRSAIKKVKDLVQARELIDIGIATNRAEWEDVLSEVRGRGPKWRQNVNASLTEIGLLEVGR
jgi:hypothetical protein